MNLAAEIGGSASASAGSNAGSGDFTLTGGSSARTKYFLIAAVIAVVFVATAFIILRRK